MRVTYLVILLLATSSSILASFNPSRGLVHSSVRPDSQPTHQSGGNGLQGGYLIVTPASRAYNAQLDNRMKEKLGIVTASKTYNSIDIETQSQASVPAPTEATDTPVPFGVATTPEYSYQSSGRAFSDIATSF